MDFTAWYQAIIDGDTNKANTLFEKAFRVLIGYLITTMNATEYEAEEVAQESLMAVYQRIREQKIEKPESVHSYIISTVRNKYLSMKRGDEYNADIDDHQHHIADAPTQILNLIDQEMQKILDWCVKQLDAKSKRFFNYWMTQPDASASKAASRFKTSENNIWVRKHRLIKELRSCVDKKQK
jgi:RNA polymerase sigma factor (sigma-70 family)